MSTAFREIIRLWVRQKRHDFHWRDIFVALYFGGLYVFMVWAIYIAIREQLGERLFVPPILASLAVPLAPVCIQMGDLLLKLFWRRSPVEMDDYLRSRPVAPKDWSRFVLLDTATGFLQWMLALMLAFVAAFFMPWWATLMVFILCFSTSMVNALFQNCWRRAPGNEWTLSLVFGYLFWTGVMWVIAIGTAVGTMAFAGLLDFQDAAAEQHFTESFVAPGLLASAALLLVNGLTGFILHRYFTRMKNHNEETHAPVSSVRSLGQVSLWSIEWVQLLRSKRLRVSFIAIAVIFLLNTYMQQMTSDSMQELFSLKVNPMLLLGVGFHSIILAQWVLGVEANFFSGIWTKPWPIEGILRRKYYFFCALCGLMTLLLIPAVLFMHLSPLALIATLLFSCGIFVLPFMATCLFSSRMDLFASAFFNYQGGNKQLNIFSFVMFIPIIIYYAAYYFLPLNWAHAVIFLLGILGIALHRPYIHWISNIWHRRRYQIMERWLTE